MRSVLRLLRRRWWLILLSLCLLASCRTVSFYTQAARGQWQIASRARPIEEVLGSHGTSAVLRSRLEVVQELRAFATTELRLPADEQYDRYCDLGRKFVVWVVYAAPEFSVEGKKWWYPLVGSLKYRGYFNEQEAEEEAARLRKAGFDVFVGGVQAYSTLGWFRDPVLNTFLSRSDAELAELLFHELTHQRLFISGDTDFNEAFATAVGAEGARRWLQTKGRLRELELYEANFKVERDFISLVLETRSRLGVIYLKGNSKEELRRLKQAEFVRLRTEAEELKKKHGAGLPVDRWFSKPVNNARLNTLATYYDLVPVFEKLLEREGGDLERLFQRVSTLKSLSVDARRAALISAAGS